MSTVQKYPAPWRLLHWVMALMVISLIPIGRWMTARGEAGLWDTLTNALYSWHKAIGFAVLILMVVRLGMKMMFRTPPYPSTLSPGLQKAAKGLHHLMYVMLFATPLLGWAGVTAFPALITLGGYHLPAMPGVPVDRALSSLLFQWHGLAASALALLLIGHIAAAFRHMFRKDGIFKRML
jgi:cytochrome b561